VLYLFRTAGALGGGGAFCNTPATTWGAGRDNPPNGDGLP
jgi:hypothetical protein